MDAWKWLGIEPTKDLKTIKIAYANRSKQYHPEEYPEEFKQLQDAYKAAVRFAKGDQDASIELQEQKYDGFWEQEQTTGIARENQKEDKSENKNEQKLSYEEIPQIFHLKESEEERFFRQLEYMLWHPYVRRRVIYWKCFMQQERYEMLMMEKPFRVRFLNRLCQENYFFHPEVRSYFVDLWKRYANIKWNIDLYTGRIFTLKKECYTKAEKEIYDKLWNDRNDSETEEAKKYLEEYFWYAELNEEKLVSVYLEAKDARVTNRENRNTMVVVLFLVVSFGAGLFFQLGSICFILLGILFFCFLISQIIKK